MVSSMSPWQPDTKLGGEYHDDVTLPFVYPVRRVYRNRARSLGWCHDMDTPFVSLGQFDWANRGE